MDNRYWDRERKARLQGMSRVASQYAQSSLHFRTRVLERGRSWNPGHRVSMGRAPQLQPDVTEPETTAAQALHMRRTTETEPTQTAAFVEAQSEFHRWHEVGWIVPHSGSVGIARQGTEMRSRGSGV